MLAVDDTEEEDLTLDAQDAGLAFRAEMWVKDTLMGYWMYFVTVVVVFLLGFLIYGVYINQLSVEQRESSKTVAQIERKIGGRIVDLGSKQASGQTLDEAKLTEVAGQLMAVDASGAARAEALMKAAELYRLTKDTEKQQQALSGVVAEGVQPFAYLANSSLANIELEAGANDAAIGRLQAEMKAHDNYLGEQAALDLGMIFEHLERPSDARAVYTEFTERWKDSPRKSQVDKRLAALKSEG